ncbi:MAG: MauE/DoxX family redox-associated membrane protein [Pyrinomonadaceae bacterium]
MDVLLLLIRIFLAAIFAVAGVGKLLDLEGSEKAVKAFGTPEEFAKFFAIALPFAEIVFAVCLLFTSTSWLGAIGATILLLSFIGGMIRQIAQGNAPDCHCFGAIHSEPVSKKSLIRNIIFAILSFFLVAQGRDSQGLGFTDLTNEMAIQLILGLATVALLGAVVYFLKKISEQQTQIMRRIELLEVLSHEGGREIEREDVSDPHEGLPIGAPAPDFSARDLAGKIVSFENLLVKNKPMILFFFSPSCMPCQALLPEIESWQNKLKENFNFVFISKGKEKENAEKFGGTNFKQILLQKDNEIAEAFKAVWTPTAVLINADGTIASHLAAGDVAIRSLLENVKLLENETENFFVTNGTPTQIGETVPEFSIENLEGTFLTAEDFIGKKTLLTYWSLSCGWCDKMLDDLREWDNTRGADEPQLILLSAGEAEKHRELGLQGQIILEEDKNISKKLGMEGTPSAVLINENGKIASEVAVGAENIFALIGKRK